MDDTIKQGAGDSQEKVLPDLTVPPHDRDETLIRKVLDRLLPFIAQQTDIFFSQLRSFRMGGENAAIRMDDKTGLWIGHAQYASAPFKVNLAGELYTGGTLKTAVVRTTDGMRELYTVESPEVWFMDFCVRKRLPSPFWAPRYTYDMDTLFTQATQAPYFYIPTTTKDVYLVYGKRRFMAHKRMEQVSEKDYKQNERFWRKQRPTKQYAKRGK